MNDNTAAAIELLLALLTQASRISELLRAAQTDVRPISDTEWAIVLAENDYARERLAQAIADAKGNTP